LQGKRVLSLDLAGLIAGSGIRGQFEEKFKALLKDIEAEVTYSYMLSFLRLIPRLQGGKAICFIDELR
jgi:ATP-dependent Clp protease ATP-binding subunit ClpB